jgi:hypothetical protein
MATAWVTIEDAVFQFLPDPGHSLRSFGVIIDAKGPRKSPRETWWRVDFEPTSHAYPENNGDILPLTYFLGPDGKLAVTGPGGTITEPA